MNSNKLQRLKVSTKRLKPLKALPKLKGVADELGTTAEDSALKNRVLASASTPRGLEQGHDNEKTAKEDQELEKGGGHKSVEFVSQNQKHLICEDLLRQGYIEAFHDFFSLLVAWEDRLGAKLSLVEKGLPELRDSLVRAEEENAAGNWLKVVSILTDIAEKFLEGKVGEAARYFFEKVAGLLEGYLLEDKIESGVYFQRFISTKLGLVKCFDLDRESEEALQILEEIYAKTDRSDDFQEEIALQLVNLYLKLGQAEEEGLNFESGLRFYEKCLKVCIESGMAKEECTLVLRVARALKKMGQTDRAVEAIRGIRQKNVKLPRDFATKFDIACFKLLAKCFERMGDFEEAENNYKSFYELLKLSDEQKDSFAGKPSLKLGDIYWRKENWKEGLRYYLDYFEEGLRAKARDRTTINHARVTLSVAKGLDEFENFLEYFQMSRNRADDIMAFKRHRRLL